MSKISELIESGSYIHVFKPTLFKKELIVEDILYIHHDNPLTRMGMFRLPMEDGHIFLELKNLNPQFDQSKIEDFDYIINDGFFCLKKEEIKDLIQRYIKFSELRLLHMKQAKVDNILKLEKPNFKSKVSKALKKINKDYLLRDERDNFTVEIGLFLEEENFRIEVLDTGLANGSVYNSDEYIEEDDYVNGVKDYPLEIGRFKRIEKESKSSFMTTFVRKEDLVNTTILERQIIEEFIKFLTVEIQQIDQVIHKKWTISQRNS